jgi:hypothetical protein
MVRSWQSYRTAFCRLRNSTNSGSTGIVEAVQQNQTLSLRISEGSRRLEEIRKLAALRKGENVSTSENG